MQVAEWFSLMDMDDHHVLDGVISHQPWCLTDYFHMIIPVPVDTDMQETKPGAGRYDPIISFVIYTLIYSQLITMGTSLSPAIPVERTTLEKPPCGCSQHRRFLGRRRLSLRTMHS